MSSTDVSPATDVSSPDGDDTRWLDAEQQSIWRAFLGGTTVLMDRLDRDLREAHGLSMAEYEILVRLSEAPDHTIRMAELAGAVSHSRSRITHTVTRLERADMVARIKCDSDGRGVNASLTEAGFAALQAAAHTHVNGVRDYLVETASADDLAAVGRVMSRVVDRLDGRTF